jgi:hypothetical protein
LAFDLAIVSEPGGSFTGPGRGSINAVRASMHCEIPSMFALGIIDLY